MKPARISRRHLIGAACWCGVAPCLSLAQDSVRLQDRWMVTQRFRLRVVVVAHGLVFPWAMACLPDGRYFGVSR